MKLKVTCFIALFLMVSVNILNTDTLSFTASLGDEETPKEAIVSLNNANIPGFQEGSIYTNTTLSSGYGYICAILDNGSVSCWGQNSYGQLGDGTGGDGTNYHRNTPAQTSSLGTNRTAVAISSGSAHTCAILDDGTVSCWGWNYFGQLGDGTAGDVDTYKQNTPSQTSSLGANRTAVAISSGSQHTCAILDDGTVSCWGSNSAGSLGDGTDTDRYAPTQTSSLGTGRTAVAISSGPYHTCAILDDGTVSCWGYNSAGGLGDGTYTDRYAPTQTLSLGTGRTAVAISSGTVHTCAILDDGTVSCWGGNGNGQLGDGTGGDHTDTYNRYTPTQTSSLGTGRTAVAISSGYVHTCAVLDNGSVSCWGQNSAGQLGDGTGVYGTQLIRNTPTQTSSLGTGRTAVAISSRNYHTCTILDDGTVSCWGNNDKGQLGDGTTTYRYTPTQTLSLGTNRTAAVSERDFDNDGLLNIFDPTWEQSDTDGDGIENSQDSCPEWFGEDCASPEEWFLASPTLASAGYRSMDYSPDGTMLASSTGNSIALNEGMVVKVWNTSTGELIHSIPCDCSNSYSLVFSPDNSILAISQKVSDDSTYGNNRVTIWDTTSWNLLTTFGNETDTITDLSFSPDGTMLAYSSDAGMVNIWDTSNWSFIHSMATLSYQCVIDFSQNGDFLAIASSNEVIIYNVNNWSVETSIVEFGTIEDSLTDNLNGTSNIVVNLEFAPNGIWLITASNDGNIRVWSIDDWNLIGNFPVHYLPIMDMVVSPDSSTVVSVSVYSPNPSVIVLDLNSGVKQSYSFPCGEIWSIAYSPNGKQLAWADVSNGCETEGFYIYFLEGDSDADGILESKDICPNTDPNAEANSQGCASNQVDSDDDGVYDYQDQCAGTPDGSTVNNIGCSMTQIDSDADGISDATDQCSNTPNGEIVGLNGCSSSQTDSDNDGVFDSKDNCPSTPSSTAVDSTGCAQNDVVDLDSDRDGVRDSADSCPNTSTGVVVDSTGCETSGDVKVSEDKVQSGELDEFFYGFCGLIFVLGVLGLLISVSKSFISNDEVFVDDEDDENYEIITLPNELQNVMAELEQQKRYSEQEMTRLRQQQRDQQSSASQITSMQQEMMVLKQRVADSEQVKSLLQSKIENVKLQKDDSIKMQDSVIGGDMITSGSTKIENQTNVTGFDADTLTKLLDRERANATETAKMAEELELLKKERRE